MYSPARSRERYTAQIHETGRIFQFKIYFRAAILARPKHRERIYGLTMTFVQISTLNTRGRIAPRI